MGMYMATLIFYQQIDMTSIIRKPGAITNHSSNYFAVTSDTGSTTYLGSFIYSSTGPSGTITGLDARYDNGEQRYLLDGLSLSTATYKSHVSQNLSFGEIFLTGHDNINGSAYSDYIKGFTGNDSMAGFGGDDTLDGGGGADNFWGGEGSDIYYVDNAGDTVTEYADEGIDEVRSTISFDLSVKGDNVENLTLLGAAAINAIGNGLDNRLIGNIAGNLLDGGLGADFMYGEKGNDTYVIDNFGDVVTEFLTAAQGGGIDTVKSSITYTLGDNLDKLILTGNDAIDATGNELNNTLTGNEGDNALNGGQGADTLTGGAGADRFVFVLRTETGLTKGYWDVITDFHANQGDRIDFSGLDANDATPNALDHFSFIGAAAFSTTNATGQLRFDAANHVLYGSTDADAAAEFALQLTGVTHLDADAFIL